MIKWKCLVSTWEFGYTYVLYVVDYFGKPIQAFSKLGSSMKSWKLSSKTFFCYLIGIHFVFEV